jgi:hypothetical protein
MAIGWKYFPDHVILDVIGLVWPLIWIPYFRVSKRVRGVFFTRDWERERQTGLSLAGALERGDDADEGPGAPGPPDEARWITRRALFGWLLAIAVLLLAWHFSQVSR